MNSYITEWTESWGNEALDFSYCDTCLLNPFDPDVADVWLISERWDDSLEEWVDPKRTNAFYYVQFDRNHNVTSNYMAHDSLGYFDWTPLPNQPEFLHQNREFRGRLAYRDSGTYRITARAWAEGYHQSEPVIVQIVHSESPGYVRVHPENPTFLSFENGELHYPCGPNIQVNGRIEKVPLWSSSDYLEIKPVVDFNCDIIGVDSVYYSNLKVNQTNWSINEWGKAPLHQAQFLALHDQISSIAGSGVSSCRIVCQPWSFELEYSLLGDYSGSMHRIWELDKLIERVSDSNLTIQWNLQSQIPLNHNPYLLRYHGWGSTSVSDTVEQSIYCYHNPATLGINDPVEFFQNEDAKQWYKKKLRYFFARFGFSTAIGVIEVYSEISGVEKQNSDLSISHPYVAHQDANLQAEYVDAIDAWQSDILSYIQNDLNASRHPIAVSYLTDGPNDSDSSYQLADVYCQSCYTSAYDFFETPSVFVSQNELKPTYCSEIGLGYSPISDLGARNAQILQATATYNQFAGCGFDWVGTIRTDTTILKTEAGLKDFADSVRFTENEFSPLHFAEETPFALLVDAGVAQGAHWKQVGTNDGRQLVGLLKDPNFTFSSALSASNQNDELRKLCESVNSIEEYLALTSDIQFIVSDTTFWQNNSIVEIKLYNPTTNGLFEESSPSLGAIVSWLESQETGEHRMLLINLEYLPMRVEEQQIGELLQFEKEESANKGLMQSSHEQREQQFYYPNPTDSYLCFPTLEDQNKNVELITTQGVVALREETEQCIDVSNLRRGLYVVSVNGRSIGKVVLQ
jgi:hypothetical protein